MLLDEGMSLTSVESSVALAALESWMKDRDTLRLLGLVVGCEAQERPLYGMGFLSGHVRDDNRILGSARIFQQ